MTHLRFLALAAVFAAPASAQLTADADPVHGVIPTVADRAEVSFDVRATEDVGDFLDEPGCVGYLDPSAPDVVLEWDGGDLEVSTAAPFDATLVISTPDGWACNDDGNGLSPVVEIRDAPAGRYAVWLGAYAPNPFDTQVTLYAGMPPPAPVLDANAAPASGSVAVARGFEASQGAIEITVDAGGPDDASEIDLSDTPMPPLFCNGFIDADRPTVALDYAADGGAGTLVIRAMSSDDLTLVVQGPDGGVLCNDDFAGLDPAVVLPSASEGTYVVWVGTFSGGPPADGSATLTVAETEPEIIDDFDFGDEEFTFERTPYSEGTYTPLDVATVPDVRLSISAESASAEVSVAPVAANPVQGDACRGYVETAATAAVSLSGDGPFALSASAEPDLTLTVRTPSGGWLCSDDADGLNPGIQIDAPEPGDYLVWVGTFGDPSFSDEASATTATLTAAPGEIVVSGGFGEPSFGRPDTQTEGTYDGAEIRAGGAAVTVELSAGDTVAEERILVGGPVLNPVDGAACQGFVSERPTMEVEATGAGIEASAMSDTDDLTLVVLAPDGTWTCSDDADGRNPRVQTTGGAGTYSVWVGTFSRRAEGVAASIGVSDFVPPLPPPPPPPPAPIRG